jgi:hypothetical protein
MLFLVLFELFLAELRPLIEQALHDLLVFPVDPSRLLLFDYVVERSTLMLGHATRTVLTGAQGRVGPLTVHSCCGIGILQKHLRF